MDTDGTSRSGSPGRISRLFGSKPPGKITEDDIMFLVETGEDEGILLHSQSKMIENVLKFRKIAVYEIMTHRVDIEAVEEHAKIADVLKIGVENGFSRIPVYKEDIDNIIGAVYVKDLLGLIGKENVEDKPIGSFIRELPYIPETIKCFDLFRQFTENHQHFAVVVDKYGGTSGIVTMEDILEAIVGKIQDEYDDEHDDITKVNQTTFIIQGHAALDRVSEALDVRLESDSDFDTIGGFLINALGRIPDENEHPVLKYGGIEFTVLVVQKRHIAKVRAVKLVNQC